MGLKKKKKLPTGVEVEYWAINRLIVFPNQLGIYVNGYLNKKVKDEGGTDIVSYGFNLPLPKGKKIKNPYKFVYKYLKKEYEELKGATDVLEDDDSDAVTYETFTKEQEEKKAKEEAAKKAKEVSK